MVHSVSEGVKQGREILKLEKMFQTQNFLSSEERRQLKTTTDELNAIVKDCQNLASAITELWKLWDFFASPDPNTSVQGVGNALS